MSLMEQNKVALSDEDMGQVIGGFSLDLLVAGSGGGAARTMQQVVIPGRGLQATTMQQVVIPGSGLQATTLQGGARVCTKCGKPLAFCKCKGSLTNTSVEI